MHRFISCALIGVLATSTFAGFPLNSAFAEEPSEEETNRFRELTALGNAKFEEGDYDAAAQAFIDAYAIRQVSNILYNVGRIYEEGGRLSDALTYFERFVKAPKVEKEARADALERIQTIKAVLALEDARKDVEPVEVAEAPPLPSPKPQAPDRTLAYTLLGVGGAALGTSLVFGILAAGEFDTFETANALSVREDAARSGKTYSLVSDSLLVSGLILVGVGTGLFLTADVGDSEVAIAPYVGADEVGVGWVWTY